MTSFDRYRRAVSVALVIAALVLAPCAALAAFTSKKNPTLSVNTAQMVAPSNVTTTSSCTKAAPNESIQVGVTGFTDTGPAGATYVYRLRLSGVTKTSTSSTSPTATLSWSITDDNASTVWTLTIQATLGNWTGPTFSRNFTCPA